MQSVGRLYQSGDWKSEKHVPVIDCPDQVKADELFDVKLTLGKEVAHANTTEHHIRWIELVFQGSGDRFPHEIGRFEFLAHGESVEGPNKGPAYTTHSVVASMRLSKSGVLHAIAFCNIHGLWENAKEVKVK